MRTLVTTVVLLVAMATHGIHAKAQTAAPQRVGDPVNGKAVFAFGNTSCTNCHGLDAQGGWGPDLAGRGITYEKALQAIRNPMWRMPAFVPSQLTDKEVLDMVAYWKSLPVAPAIGKWRTVAPVSAPWGQQVAVNIVGCAQCHGATLRTPRHGAAEVNGDFEWFKRAVYNHAAAQVEKWKLLDSLAAPAPPPTRGRVRMGNFSPKRLPESTLREMWDWMNDLGLLVPVSARLTGGAARPSGTPYTLELESEAMPNKGLAAEDVIVSLVLPAGAKVVSAGGPGYQGVTSDEKVNGGVAVWRIASLAPRDHYTFTITVSGTPAGNSVLRGTVGWAKPAAKADALVNFVLEQRGGRGRGAGE